MKFCNVLSVNNTYNCVFLGLAETGSGKTGSFAIPILQSLLENPQRLYAVILAPTRYLYSQSNHIVFILYICVVLFIHYG